MQQLTNIMFQNKSKLFILFFVGLFVVFMYRYLPCSISDFLTRVSSRFWAVAPNIAKKCFTFGLITLVAFTSLLSSLNCVTVYHQQVWMYSVLYGLMP